MTDGSVEVGGRRWAFVEAGEGPLLLLFHGTLSGKETFADHMEPLSQYRRVVAMDWPGHGGTEFDPEGWTVDELVDAVPQLIDALGAETATIGGVSQGGAVSLRATIRYPERVDALITMAAAPDRPGPPAQESMAALGKVLHEGDDAERRDAVEKFQRERLHAPGWVEANPQRAREEFELILGHPREAAPAVTRIPRTYDSVEDRIAEIECPMLILWGEHDARGTKWGPTMEELIPNSRLEVIAGAGHHLTLDAPEAVSEAIIRFLRELDA